MTAIHGGRDLIGMENKLEGELKSLGFLSLHHRAVQRFSIHSIKQTIGNDWQSMSYMKNNLNQRKVVMMATMNISVPDPMKDWVQSQVNTGAYANTSDYIRDLIRQDQKNRNKIAALQTAITAGLDSGESDKSFDDIINQVRNELKDKK